MIISTKNILNQMHYGMYGKYIDSFKGIVLPFFIIMIMGLMISTLTMVKLDARGISAWLFMNAIFQIGIIVIFLEAWAENQYRVLSNHIYIQSYNIQSLFSFFKSLASIVQETIVNNNKMNLFLILVHFPIIFSGATVVIVLSLFYYTIFYLYKFIECLYYTFNLDRALMYIATLPFYRLKPNVKIKLNLKIDVKTQDNIAKNILKEIKKNEGNNENS